MTDVKPPSLGQLRTDTTVASAKVSAAGMLSKPDFDDMNDGTVSTVDKAIAARLVHDLTGYVEDGSFADRLPKDLPRAKAKEMLESAKEMQRAVAAQYKAQGFTRTLLENAKDEFRPQVRAVVRTVRSLVSSADSE